MRGVSDLRLRIFSLKQSDLVIPGADFKDSEYCCAVSRVLELLG